MSQFEGFFLPVDSPCVCIKCWGACIVFSGSVWDFYYHFQSIKGFLHPSLKRWKFAFVPSPRHYYHALEFFLYVKLPFTFSLREQSIMQYFPRTFFYHIKLYFSTSSGRYNSLFDFYSLFFFFLRFIRRCILWSPQPLIGSNLNDKHCLVCFMWSFDWYVFVLFYYEDGHLMHTLKIP